MPPVVCLPAVRYIPCPRDPGHGFFRYAPKRRGRPFPVIRPINEPVGRLAHFQTNHLEVSLSFVLSFVAMTRSSPGQQIEAVQSLAIRRHSLAPSAALLAAPSGNRPP